MVTIPKSEFELPPEGTHTGILYMFADKGTHERMSERYGKTINRELYFAWELPDERMRDNRPFAQSKTYNAARGTKAKLVQDLGAAYKFDVTETPDFKGLLGKPCNITIEHYIDGKGNTRSKIVAMAPLKKGEAVPPLTNDRVYFDLDAFDGRVFARLPEWLQNEIKKSPEYLALNDNPGAGMPETAPETQNIPVEEIDDEIPF